MTVYMDNEGHKRWRAASRASLMAIARRRLAIHRRFDRDRRIAELFEITHAGKIDGNILTHKGRNVWPVLRSDL